MTPLTFFTQTQMEAFFNSQNDPVQPASLIKVLAKLAKVQYGTLEVANTGTTGTAAVGAEFNGKPVFAMLNEVDGTKSVVAAVIAAGTLTVTMSAAVSADRTVAYIILGA
jgi:hypothetical protein